MALQPDGMHIAHFNWGSLVADIDSPKVAPFVNAVAKVNALAERSPGFVWRNGDEARDAVKIGWELFTENPRMIASFSVWERPEDISAYVYQTVHGAFFRRSAEWFVPKQSGHVLWWVPQGHIPDIAEARSRVEHLLAHGPSDDAFTFSALLPGPQREGVGEMSPSPVPS